MSKLIIGIDQSYSATGIGVAVDGKLTFIGNIGFKGCKSKTEKRRAVAKLLDRKLKLYHDKYEIEILVERIRTITSGSKIRPDYLKSTGALIACIVDIAFDYGVKVYSVDTRSWKSKSIPAKYKTKQKKAEYENYPKPEKMACAFYMKDLGFDVVHRNKDGSVKRHKRGKNAGKVMINDDKCDAGGIALYGFNPDRLLLDED